MFEDIVDYIAVSIAYRINLTMGANNSDSYDVSMNLVLAIKHIYWRDNGLCHISDSRLDS